MLLQTAFFNTTTQRPSYLLEVSADLSAVHSIYGYGSGGSTSSQYVYHGSAALLDSGELLIQSFGVQSADSTPGILRLSTSWAVQSHKIHTGAGDDSGIGLTMRSDGSGVMLISRPGSTNKAFLYSLIDNGANASALTELATVYRVDANVNPLFNNYRQIDLAGGRLCTHAFDGHSVMAQGWMVSQPSDQISLSVGTGQNATAQTIAPSPGTSSNGPNVTRYNATVSSNVSATITTSSGSLSLVDASTSLDWELKRSFG
jgi:hypothetical protein